MFGQGSIVVVPVKMTVTQVVDQPGDLVHLSTHSKAGILMDYVMHQLSATFLEPAELHHQNLRMCLS